MYTFPLLIFSENSFRVFQFTFVFKMKMQQKCNLQKYKLLYCIEKSGGLKIKFTFIKQ